MTRRASLVRKSNTVQPSLDARVATDLFANLGEFFEIFQFFLALSCPIQMFRLLRMLLRRPMHKDIVPYSLQPREVVAERLVFLTNRP